MSKEESLLYREDDVSDQLKRTVIHPRHEKFYSIEPDPRRMKLGILKWLRDTIPSADAGDNIFLLLISHGTDRGSVVIGGEGPTDFLDYLTNVDVRSSVANLIPDMSFTFFNTCYSKCSVNSKPEGQGKGYVLSATRKRTRADNHLIWEISGSLRHRHLGLFKEESRWNLMGIHGGNQDQR